MSDKPDDDFSAPLNLFLGCHVLIKNKMERMRELPGMLAPGGDASAASHLAADIIGFFETVVGPHHAEEERELWPMLDRVAPGTEGHETVHAIVHRLKAEHKQLEDLWRHLEPSLHKVARGKPADVDANAVAKLARMYDDHAAFEDAVVLPMAKYLMDPADQYRLAMSMALSRHPINAYI